MRFLFVDRILQLSPGKVIQGIKHVTNDDAYLCADSQGKACFIPSLIGETLGQLAAWNVMFANDFKARPVAGIVASARLYRPAYLGETLYLESFIDHLDEQAVHYHSIARIDDETIFTVDGALGPLLPMENFIDPTIAKYQFDEINRPGNFPKLLNPKFNHPIKFLPHIPRSTPMIFDHIFACEPGVSLVAEKLINRAASYFPDHFPLNPVLPMTVLLECKLNLAYEFIARSGYRQEYVISEFRKIKMNEFVYPGDVLTCTVKVKECNDHQLILSYRSEVAGKRVCVLEVIMMVKGNEHE